MTLIERIATAELICRESGCKRLTTHADQPYCAEHRLRWVPTWRKRLTAKDMTRSAA